MQKTFLLILGVVILSGAIFLIWDKEVPTVNTNQNPEPVACTMEAKLCPDGSYVGRTGPKCEFTACPTTQATTGNIVLAIGQMKKLGDLSVILNSVSNDSRCPIDVQCIQAGTVSVTITLIDSTHTETKNIRSDQAAYIFGKNTISIVNVSPVPHSQKRIINSDYRVTFQVK